MLVISDMEIALFHHNRDKALQAFAGVGKGEECLFWRAVVVLRILSRALGGICTCYNLQAKTLVFMVGSGLFHNGTGSCLAGSLSMGGNVLADGPDREVSGRKKHCNGLPIWNKADTGRNRIWCHRGQGSCHSRSTHFTDLISC